MISILMSLPVLLCLTLMSPLYQVMVMNSVYNSINQKTWRTHPPDGEIRLFFICLCAMAQAGAPGDTEVGVVARHPAESASCSTKTNAAANRPGSQFFSPGVPSYGTSRAIRKRICRAHQ